MSRQILDFEDVRIEFEQKGRVLQGEASTVEYELTNTSKGYLLFGFRRCVEGYDWEMPPEVQRSPIRYGFSPDLVAPQSSVKRSIKVFFSQSGRVKHEVGLKYFKIDPKNLDEFKRVWEASVLDFISKMSDQEDVKKTLEFELEIEVEPNKNFQELYGRYKPRDMMNLERWGYTALVTDEGTILVKKGEAINIGYVELSALRRMEELGGRYLEIWVKSREAGSLKPLLEKYGIENLVRADEKYHGEFNYFIRLPKSELFEFFECIRKGKYRVFPGRGYAYGSDIWVLGPKERLERIYDYGIRGLGNDMIMG